MPVTERSFLGSEDCSEWTQAIGQQCRRAGDRSHDILGAMVDERLATMIDVLLKSGRKQLAVPFEATPETVPNEAFSLACIARCADLLEGELLLYNGGQWSLARILGRTLTEFWLYGQHFLLDGDRAVEEFMEEDQRHQATQEFGHNQVWEQLESHRAGGIDTRTGYEEPTTARRPNLSVLAGRVRELRDEQGYSGGIAVVRYNLSYRWDSAVDVHPTFDLLRRYFRIRPDNTLAVEPVPEVVDNRDLSTHINEELRLDANLLADLLGIYFQVRNDTDGMSRLQTALATATGKDT